MKSLSTRLTVWYALAATITAAIFLVVGQLVLERSFIEGVDMMNDSEFEEIEPRILDYEAQGSEEAAVKAILDHTEIDAALFFFQVGHSHNETFFTSSNMAGHALPVSVHRMPRITINDSELGALRVSEYQAGGYDVHIASSLEGLHTLNQNLVRIALMILVAVFLTSLVVGYILSRIALNPIANIQKTASRINGDNLGERIVISDTKDEVADLAKLLNAMFDRLQSSFKQVQRFTADASHELKTPLSLIRINAEELLNSLGGGSENRRNAEAQIDEVERMNHVINDLLILSKADAGVLDLKLESCSVKECLDDFVQDAILLCEDKGLRFDCDNSCERLVRIDRVWLRNTFFNLLSNAIKFSPEGGLISMKSFCREEGAFIVMEDEGPGVDDKDLDRIFDRFFRKSSLRGSGLGLALCRSIVEQHGGIIGALNRTDRSGLRVELRLPLLDQ